VDQFLPFSLCFCACTQAHFNSGRSLLFSRKIAFMFKFQTCFWPYFERTGFAKWSVFDCLCLGCKVGQRNSPTGFEARIPAMWCPHGQQERWTAAADRRRKERTKTNGTNRCKNVLATFSFAGVPESPLSPLSPLEETDLTQISSILL
jgi:hypothetical protein